MIMMVQGRVVWIQWLWVIDSDEILNEAGVVVI
jgi:hypothetical protein